MKTATIRDLRTRFPAVRRLLELEGEVVVTERGKPVLVLRGYEAPARTPAVKVQYYARLRRRMRSALPKSVRQALDEADRGER
jgi:antitoxin (DNA-binding transcriptional repressor) of toxin-antitoxin stability system